MQASYTNWNTLRAVLHCQSRITAPHPPDIRPNIRISHWIDGSNMSWTVLCCKFISVSLHRCSNGKDALCSSRCGIGKHHYIYMTLMKRRWARLFSKTSCRYNPCPHIWFMQWLISASFSNQIENSLHQLVEVFWSLKPPVCKSPDETGSVPQPGLCCVNSVGFEFLPPPSIPKTCRSGRREYSNWPRAWMWMTVCASELAL